MFTRFLPFWIFMIFFKFGGGLHYALVSPLGEKLLPLWVVGLVMGGGSIVQFLLDVPAGKILDRWGYRRFLAITTAVFLLAAICYMFGLTMVTYILSMILSTFGWLFFGPGTNAYALSHATHHNAGRFMSLKDMFGSLGIVLSTVALPFALLMSPQLIGVVLFALLAIALVAMMLAPRDTMKATAETKIGAQHHYIRRHALSSAVRMMTRLNPASGMLLASGMAGGIFYGAVWFAVPLVMAGQANSEALGFGLGIFDFSVIVLGWLLGTLADRANKRRLVFAGLLLFAVAAAATGMDFSWLFLLFGFLATTGDELSALALWAWLHTLDKDHAEDGAVSGIINLFQDAGWAIGPIVAGFIYGPLGPTWTIVICSVPLFIAWVMYQTMMRHHHAHLSPIGGVPRKPHGHRSRH